MGWMRKAVVCAAVVGSLSQGAAPTGAAPTQDQITRALRVQTAMVRARGALEQDRPAEAVRFLENALDVADGSDAYLTLLRRAYAAQLQALALAQAPEAELAAIRVRLRTIEGEAVPDAPPAEPSAAAPTPSMPAKFEAEPDVVALDDPFQQIPLDEAAPPPDPMPPDEVRPTADPEPDGLRRASLAFHEGRFHEAAELFAREHQAGIGLSEAEKTAWGYSRLRVVVGHLNAADRSSIDWVRLEREIAEAKANCGSPELTRFAEQLAAELVRRRSAPAGPVVRANDPGGDDGWRSTAGANFRVRHVGDAGQAERALRAAEEVRSAVISRWGTSEGVVWAFACEVVLHDSADGFARATGKSAALPGTARTGRRGGEVVSRRIDLRLDHEDWLTATLPYEVAQLVLADLFADQPLPRWAAEAMAVLAQSPEQVARYQNSLGRLRASGSWIPLERLLTMTGYPNAEATTAFYVESVSLVSYLVKARGAEEFVLFLRFGQRYGFEKALEKQYGVSGFEELERRWLSHSIGS